MFSIRTISFTLAASVVSLLPVGSSSVIASPLSIHLDSIKSLGLPVITIETVDGEEPTCEYAVPPEEELLTDSLKLRYFNEMIRDAADTRFVFVFSPTWYGHHDSGIDPIMELARRHGFLFLDFTDSAKYVHRNELFYDGSHLNARGADEFTQDLIRELRMLTGGR